MDDDIKRIRQKQAEEEQKLKKGRGFFSKLFHKSESIEVENDYVGEETLCVDEENYQERTFDDGPSEAKFTTEKEPESDYIETETKRINKERSEELKNLKDEYDKEVKEYQDELIEETKGFDKDLKENLSDARPSERSELKSDYKESIKELKDTLAENLEELKDVYNSDVDDVNESCDEEIEYLDDEDDNENYDEDDNVINTEFATRLTTYSDDMSNSFPSNIMGFMIGAVGVGVIVATMGIVLSSVQDALVYSGDNTTLTAISDVTQFANPFVMAILFIPIFFLIVTTISKTFRDNNF